MGTDLEHVRQFYNEYGMREWERLEAQPEGRIIFHLHRQFLDGAVGPGYAVLDAGCGPGRFSLEMAAAGADVTLFDLSDTQLVLARRNMDERGLAARRSGCIRGDVRDLSIFPDDRFDTTVCYGAVLNYLFDDATVAARELARVTRPGGHVLVSVNSRWGAVRYFLANEGQEPARYLGRPDYWHIDTVASHGFLPPHPEVAHPPRRFFTAAELRQLMTTAGITDVELAAAPVLSTGLRARLREIASCPEAWATVLRLEERAYLQEGLLDSGYHLLARGRVA